MDLHTETHLTVKERLALEAQKGRARVPLNGKNGFHHTNGNGTNGNGTSTNGNGSNGTNGIHHTNGNGAASKKKQVHVAYQNLNVREYKGKRFLDLFLGSFAIVIFLLVLPFIAFGIKVSSRGPVFFKQKRTGKNGTTFTCYKFRTMQVGSGNPSPDTSIPDITTRGDSRIFAFGSFLRFLNLDELPQIINVFKGDMSLVGPRPYPVDECAYWNTTIDDFYFRYAVKPGITGFAQVKGYRGGTLDLDLIRKRTDYDLIYVQKNSLLFDIKTIGMTVTQMANLETNGY